MALPPTFVELRDRLASYNNGPQSTANPRGLARGGSSQGVFIAMLADFTAYGTMVATYAGGTAADRALTAEDASNTHLDRLATGADVLTSAGKVALAAAEVTKAAGKVTLAGQEADRAKGEADRAFSLAQSFNLPAITAGVAGRFLKVNSAGTAWELSPLTIATVQEAQAGTGTGLINAETFGASFSGFSSNANAQIAAALTALPPVGSYLTRPFYAVAPGPNYLEAKGQIVSLAAYPDLAAALPALGANTYGGFTNFPSDLLYAQNSGTPSSNSVFSAADMKGQKFAFVQQSYLSFWDGDAKTEKEIAPNHHSRGAILRGSDLVGFTAGVGATAITNMTPGANFGTQTVVVIAGSTSNSTASNYSNAAETANGTVLIFVPGNNTELHFQCLRLLPGATNWTAFNPAIGFFHAYYDSWVDRQGRVYLLCNKSSGETGLYLYRTDGTAWTLVWSAVPNTEGAYSTIEIGPINNLTRHALKRGYRSFQQSTDGQRMIFMLSTEHHLYSTNGGTSWTLRNNFTGGTRMGLTNAFSLSTIRVAYDAFNDRFVFAVIWKPTGTTIKMGISTSADFVTFTPRLVEATIANSGQDERITGLAVTATGRIAIFMGNTSEQDSRLFCVATDFSVSGFAMPGYVNKIVDGYPFDGLVFEARSNQGFDTLIWIANDLTYVAAANYNTANDATQRMFVRGDKRAVFAQYGSFFRYGRLFDYNPETERKLPTVTQTLTYSGANIGVYETYLPGSQTVLKHYIRVK